MLFPLRLHRRGTFLVLRVLRGPRKYVKSSMEVVWYEVAYEERCCCHADADRERCRHLYRSL
jgi:hypothetical protein